MDNFRAVIRSAVRILVFVLVALFCAIGFSAKSHAADERLYTPGSCTFSCMPSGWKATKEQARPTAEGGCAAGTFGVLEESDSALRYTCSDGIHTFVNNWS